jgi:hypothetical protein
LDQAELVFPKCDIEGSKQIKNGKPGFTFDLSGKARDDVAEI